MKLFLILARCCIFHAVLGLQVPLPQSNLRGPSTTTSTSAHAISPSLTDCTAAAAGFFGGVRIPASLIAGSCLAQMFVVSNREPKSQVDDTLIKLNKATMILSFLLTMITVVVSTAANVSILRGRFDPLAESAYYLLKREFELEFVTARVTFLLGCFSFLVGVSNRIVLEYELLRKDKRDVLKIISFALIGVVSALASYINSTLFCWNDFIHMVAHLMKRLVERVLNKRTPLMLLSLFSITLSIIFTLKVLVVYIVEATRSNRTDEI